LSECRAALDLVLAEYRKSLEIPDPSQIHAMLGTIAANMTKGEKPVWLVIIGPPSSGKSDPLGYLKCLDKVKFASEITKGGLLSCASRNKKGPDGTGGFLKEMGDFGILVISDMSSTMALGEDGLKGFLGLMREVYDGHVARFGGQDRGASNSWTGKMGFIAAATGDIDRHHASINTLGDRYLYFRMPEGDIKAKMERARTRVDNKNGIESALKALFSMISAADSPELTDGNEKTLQTLAMFVAKTRTAVARDPKDRSIQDITVPEEPTRLYLTFRTLLKGMIRIGLTETEAMAVTSKIALDSIPPTRLAIIKQVIAIQDLTVRHVETGPWVFATTAIHRALEELVKYRVLDRVGENGVPAHYSQSPWLKERVAGLPEGTFSDNLLCIWKERIEDKPSSLSRESEKVEPALDGLFDEVDGQ